MSFLAPKDGYWIIAIILLVLNFYYWQRIREHFMHGCANPGVVVSMSPMLIAVSTDLTKGEGQYPAIKIIRKNLSTINGRRPIIGTKVATVALYSAGFDENAPCWNDFYPLPVDCAMGDQKIYKAILNSFSDDDWAALRNGLNQIPRPFRKGLFHVAPII